MKKKTDNLLKILERSLTSAMGIAGIIFTLGIVDYNLFNNHQTFKKTIIKQTQKHIQYLANFEAKAFGERYSEILSDMQILSENPLIWTKNQKRLSEIDGYSLLIDFYKDSTPLVSSCYRLNADGIILERFPKKEIRAGADFLFNTGVAYVLKHHKSYVSFFKINSNKKYLNICVPIIADYNTGQNFEGMLLALVPFYLTNEKLEWSAFEGKGKIWFEDPHERTDGHYDNDYTVGQNNEVYNGVMLMATAPVSIMNQQINLVMSISYEDVVSAIDKHAKNTFYLASFLLILFGMGCLLLYRFQKRRAIREATLETSQALIESEKKYRMLVDNFDGLITCFDADGTVLFINAKASKYFSSTPENLVGESLHNLFFDQAEFFLSRHLNIIQSGEGANFEDVYDVPSGKIWMWSNIQPIKDRKGKAFAVQVISYNITERKHSEEEIKRNYQIQNALNNLLKLSIGSESLEEIYILFLQHIVSFPWLDLQPVSAFFTAENNTLILKAHQGLPESLQLICANVPFGTCLCGKAALSGDIVFASCIDERHDNLYERISPHGHYCIPVISTTNNVLGVFTLYIRADSKRDKNIENTLIAISKVLAGIIEKKRAEEEKHNFELKIHQAQKMEAIGTLAGGIAHDFNNLLMGIQGRASLMMLKTDKSHNNYEHLTSIESYVTSAADLTKQLLGLAKGGKYEVVPTDINLVIEKSSTMFGRTKKEISIHTKYQDNIWMVEIDRGQFEQVLLNLYVNAWQAMPSNGGHLYLQTDNVIFSENFIKPLKQSPGRYVRISVTDNGVGMDEETKRKIFDPFFTTKGMGRGTGLGLASAYGIISNHGGSIDVFSKKGEGTTFVIYLPASEKEAKDEIQLPEDFVRGNETILLIDDEEMIIDVAEQMLNTLGYKTYTAINGREALEVYKTHQGEIDMIILDLIMPDIGGAEAFDILKKINPDVKILLSSGYSVDGLAMELLNRGCDGFIQKPFDMKKLSLKIKELFRSD